MKLFFDSLVTQRIPFTFCSEVCSLLQKVFKYFKLFVQVIPVSFSWIPVILRFNLLLRFNLHIPQITYIMLITCSLWSAFWECYSSFTLQHWFNFHLCHFCFNLSYRDFSSTDWDQNMLPQNTALWYIEYFKLKGFEKMTDAERSLWRPSYLGFFSKTGHKFLL